MTGKTRYTKEFQAKALRLLEESRADHSSETSPVGPSTDGATGRNTGRERFAVILFVGIRVWCRWI